MRADEFQPQGWYSAYLLLYNISFKKWTKAEKRSIIRYWWDFLSTGGTLVNVSFKPIRHSKEQKILKCSISWVIRYQISSFFRRHKARSNVLFHPWKVQSHLLLSTWISMLYSLIQDSFTSYSFITQISYVPSFQGTPTAKQPLGFTKSKSHLNNASPSGSRTARNCSSSKETSKRLEPRS